MGFLTGSVCIIGIIFMLTFMFIGIWLFIVALKAYNQLRYKNYILEKISHNLDLLCKTNQDFSFDDFLTEENAQNFNRSDINKIKDFETSDN
ncbi:MAG: hypothetical protein KIB43_11135 [Clostridium baratii]|uniref:Uncharacterized protein n=1 Tax=Clostridium baratii str. Sullivan TaxID=1415775 RepID=A0A0A7FWY5_9CLOT|nr:hypothetical protein [Clostridium baratii]AIY84103.1 hypothetical protein U729_1512 [Clostridium baratii str. Sullivan]MBS6007504.1 hypothetical protein [Clostridium baratii]MDU1054859.1 hypothetical protein [Clostridium baratii]MDU4911990.1 hypothetical protein [Clostridium baratii]CUP65512.1 Uncharacterised protein [Clostridium baratii]